MTVSEPAPVVSAGAAASYTGGAGPVVLDAGLSVSDADSSVDLSNATVAIGVGFLSGETLNFVNQNGITGRYDAANGVLTLSGTATPAQYQAALESISYSSTITDPSGGGTDTSRTITWQVNDGSAINGNSNTASSTLSVLPPLATVAANNPTIADGQTVAVDPTVFTVGGSGISEYEVWFSAANQGAPALGAVTDNGTAIALNQGVDLTSLSGLDYTGGATSGTDEMWLRAYNGNWSNWVQADITDPGAPPATVTANNPTVADGQTVAVDPTVFSVSGSGISEYEVWFSAANQGAPALGSVTDNGTAIALNKGVYLTTLSGLDYTGGATAGTDEMWLRAYDGNWSGWVQADITDPGAPPATVTANNPTVYDGQTVAIDPTVFSIGGSGISEYEVWFSAANQGAPALGSVTDNGTAIALNQGVYLTTLNGLDYTGGATAGTDEMWLRAYDGNWSSWVQADITDPGLWGRRSLSPNGTSVDQQSDGGQVSGLEEHPLGGNDGTPSALWSGATGAGWLATDFAPYQSAGAMVAGSGSSLPGSPAANDLEGAQYLLAGESPAPNQANQANLPSSLDPIAGGGMQEFLQMPNAMAPTNAGPGAELPAPTFAAGEAPAILGANLFQHV